MPFTDYHAKYFACGLMKRCPSDSVEKLAGALVDARVDLNPHQVDKNLPLRQPDEAEKQPTVPLGRKARIMAEEMGQENLFGVAAGNGNKRA